MESGIFKITENDIQWVFPEEEHEHIPEISQETLDIIADRTRELMDDELGEWFWNIFDDCLSQATRENVFLTE